MHENVVSPEARPANSCGASGSAASFSAVRTRCCQLEPNFLFFSSSRRKSRPNNRRTPQATRQTTSMNLRMIYEWMMASIRNSCAPHPWAWMARAFHVWRVYNVCVKEFSKVPNWAKCVARPKLRFLNPPKFIDYYCTQRFSGSAARMNDKQPDHRVTWINSPSVDIVGLRQSCDIIKSFAADLLDFWVWFIWIAFSAFMFSSPFLPYRVHSSVSWNICFSLFALPILFAPCILWLAFVSAKLTFIACSLFQVALFCMRSLT